LNKAIYILFSLSILFVSCDYLQFKKEEKVKTSKVLARVGEEKLYEEDLTSLYQDDLSTADSLFLKSNYIEHWARKQVLLQKAALNLPKEKEIEFSELIETYKNDLYTNYYKEAVLTQNFDTVVNPKTIETFYQENQNIFRLNDELLQFRYISFRQGQMALKERKIKQLFLKNDKESLEKLLEDELKFKTIQLNDSVWSLYLDFRLLNPVFKKKSKKSILRKNTFFVAKDSLYTHMVYVKKVLKRNEIAPLNHVYAVVKQMIVHKNKLEYIKNIENKLIEDAIQNNIYEKY